MCLSRLLSTVLIFMCVSCKRDAYTARDKSAQKAIQSFQAAVLDFRRDIGRFPTEEEGLLVLITNRGVDGWKGPYIQESQMDTYGNPYRYLVMDIYGNPYRYQLVNGQPVIKSAGADGKFGSEDDISSDVR